MADLVLLRSDPLRDVTVPAEPGSYVRAVVQDSVIRVDNSQAA
ncbi:hypothetical protein [Streptomyces tsukubensis]|nr:hypothetical protein [Streptomyces tsukubensis]